MKIKLLRTVFKDFNNLVEDTIHAYRLALIKEGIETSIDTSAIKDILIDSLLTKLFGTKFLIPISTRLFVFDEDNFDLPQTRTWRVRLLSITSAFISRNRREKIYKHHLLNVLESYHQQQIKRTKNLLKEDFFIEEAILAAVIRRILFSRKMTNILRRFEKNFSKMLKRGEFPVLSTYFDYLNVYNEEFLSSLENKSSFKKEGRALCFSFQELDTLAKKEKERKQIIEKGFDLKVFRIKLIKLRFDLERLPFEELAENSSFPYAIGLSHFNLFVIDDKEVYEKLDTVKNINTFRNTRDLLFSENRNTNFYSLEDFLLSRKIAFYEDNLSLTLFNLDDDGRPCNDTLNRLKRVIEDQSKYIIILIKLKTKVEEYKWSFKRKDSNFKYIDIKQKFEGLKIAYSREGVGDYNVFVFSSYDWFDYCVLIAFSPREGKTVKLSYLLKSLKKDIILRNNELSRTETGIFIGKDVDPEKIKLPFMNILVRISGNDLGKSWSLIKRLRKDDGKFKTISSFGMRDLILQLTEEISFNEFKEIFYKIFETAKEEQIKIFDIQVEPLILWNQKCPPSSILY